MYKYTKIKRLGSREITSIAKEQTHDENSTSFQSSPKINRMLITRPILACENIRFYLLFATGDVSRGETDVFAG